MPRDGNLFSSEVIERSCVHSAKGALFREKEVGAERRSGGKSRTKKRRMDGQKVGPNGPRGTCSKL